MRNVGTDRDQRVEILRNQMLTLSKSADSTEFFRALVRARDLIQEKQYSEAMRYFVHAFAIAELDLPVDRPTSTNRFKRRWARRKVRLPMHIHDFTDVSLVKAEVVSMSAGGCLISLETEPPDEFNFSLDLDAHSINGLGKRVYTEGSKKFGVRFDGLSSRDEDLLNKYIISK